MRRRVYVVAAYTAGYMNNDYKEYILLRKSNQTKKLRSKYDLT